MIGSGFLDPSHFDIDPTENVLRLEMSKQAIY